VRGEKFVGLSCASSMRRHQRRVWSRSSLLAPTSLSVWLSATPGRCEVEDWQNRRLTFCSVIIISCFCFRADIDACRSYSGQGGIEEQLPQFPSPKFLAVEKLSENRPLVGKLSSKVQKLGPKYPNLGKFWQKNLSTYRP